MPDDQALLDWELHTLDDMKGSDNHHHPIKFWSWEIIRSMRWFGSQPMHTTHLIFAPPRCFDRDTPPKYADP